MNKNIELGAILRYQPQNGKPSGKSAGMNRNKLCFVIILVSSYYNFAMSLMFAGCLTVFGKHVCINSSQQEF